MNEGGIFIENKWLISAFNERYRKVVEPPGFTREETETVVRHISLTEEKSFISYSNFNEDETERIIDSEIEYFSKSGKTFEWKVYDFDQPPELKSKLKNKGFMVEEPEALMILPLKSRAALTEGFVPKTNVTEIDDETGIGDLVRLENSIWKESHKQLGERLWRDKQTAPESLYIYGIYENNQLVSGSWIYFEPNTNFASLWGGSTLPEFRGRGFYSDLLRTRAIMAVDKGYSFLTVDASPMSRPILEKLGFHFLGFSFGCQSPSS
ncbi:GNAT family N-acetyltransferase [Sediminibacillus massiliensis]|uniref:GNAT family N-acetyltransferase n=1 Tax=Sediminibacillus massiliensis TaxID=1926277 RepID=UPI001FE7BB22|nr:GNAT family N-acetyltransferase [Sediminibacillus massiliensis]